MIEKLKQNVQKFFEGYSHGWDHVMRVYRHAEKILESEHDADKDVVLASVLLHDMCRKEESDGKVECHADAAAEKAESVLKEVDFPEEKIPKVEYCIRVHRYSKGITPETIEAKILQDADRLDAVGAIAIARTFTKGAKRPIHDPSIPPKESYDGSSETTLNHFHEKLLRIKPETFHTHTGQMLAKERSEFMQLYVNHFLEEWDGKR